MPTPPRLLIFAPCDRVIIDGQNLVSLITIFREIRVNAGANAIEPSAVVPTKWHIITVWYIETPTDTEYEQRILLATPSGEAVLEIPVVSLDLSKTEFRHVTSIEFFPVGRPGDLRLILFLREAGTDEWQEIAEYPMGVRYETAAQP